MMVGNEGLRVRKKRLLISEAQMLKLPTFEVNVG